jgi:hypothetical protein
MGKIHVAYLRGTYCHTDNRIGKSAFLYVKAGGTYSYPCALKGREVPADKIVERMMDPRKSWHATRNKRTADEAEPCAASERDVGRANSLTSNNTKA